MSAEAVAASFQRSWETQPAAAGFIPKETQIVPVDARTLEFRTPRPVGGFTNSLATFQFVVHKPGDDGSVMTGPYRPVKYEVDKDLTMEAYAGHWVGPPPIARINIQLVPDANARALALQSGDVDMVFGPPPEILEGLPGDIERAVIPSTREHLIILNHTRLPFSDRAVRAATSLAIDRASLNRVAMDDLGAVVTGIFPSNAGVNLIGFTAGALAATGSRVLNGFLGRLLESLMALPGLVTALALTAVLGPSFRNLLLALVVTSWRWYARAYRSILLKERSAPYVEGAAALGATRLRTLLRHVLPNVVGPAVVLATANLGGVMLGLAALSFLGLGRQPPAPEWGVMINDARVYFQRYPWQMIAPGLCIVVTVLAVNLTGDALRDLLDPRGHGRR
ncbi:MAG: ABC transporter substrate-binding protein [Dehalococcoidia bacterium]